MPALEASRTGFRCTRARVLYCPVFGRLVDGSSLLQVPYTSVLGFTLEFGRSGGGIQGGRQCGARVGVYLFFGQPLLLRSQPRAEVG